MKILEVDNQKSIDVVGLGNAIADILDNSSEEFLKKHSLIKGSMTIIDEKYAENTLEYILNRSDSLHSSLKEDFDQKRPLEVDEILGEAYRTGVKNNVDMTNCKMVYEKLIKFAKV